MKKNTLNPKKKMSAIEYLMTVNEIELKEG